MALAGHVANYKIYSSVLINFGRGIRKGNIFTATNRHDYFGRVRLLICCGRMKNARLILDKASVFFMDKKVYVFQGNPFILQSMTILIFAKQSSSRNSF